jgi:hypothetical protein
MLQCHRCERFNQSAAVARELRRAAVTVSVGTAMCEGAGDCEAPRELSQTVLHRRRRSRKGTGGVAHDEPQPKSRRSCGGPDLDLCKCRVDRLEKLKIEPGAFSAIPVGRDSNLISRPSRDYHGRTMSRAHSRELALAAEDLGADLPPWASGVGIRSVLGESPLELRREFG